MNCFWKLLFLLLIVIFSTGTALMCFDSTQNATVQCKHGENCIKIVGWPMGVIEKRCGTCEQNESEDIACIPCSTDNCIADGIIGPNDAALHKTPKCSVGAGNGAAAYFVDQPCTNPVEKQDNALSVRCFQEKVNGILYKGCGGCSDRTENMVDVHTISPKVDDNGQEIKLKIDKCIECETEAGADPCNVGLVPMMPSVVVWLFVGVAIPIMLLSMANPFTRA